MSFFMNYPLVLGSFFSVNLLPVRFSHVHSYPDESDVGTIRFEGYYVLFFKLV